MTAKSEVQEGERAPSPHVVTNSWTTGAIRCGGCNQPWEQPNYADDGSTWVCPYCLHAAGAQPRQERHGR